jgi:hypothetical protein
MPSEGFADFPVPRASGRMMKYFFRVQRLAVAKQLAREIRRQHGAAGAGGAVQHQHRLARRLADRGVMQA